MARVLQIDGDGRFALHGDGVLDDPHVFPLAAVFVLVAGSPGSCGHVEIFAVVAEDGQAPRAVLVAPDRHAGQHRLAAADQRPSRARPAAPSNAATARSACGADPVHHHREAALREAAAHDPVVAPDVLRPRAQVDRRRSGGGVERRRGAGLAAVDAGAILVRREPDRLAEGADTIYNATRSKVLIKVISNIRAMVLSMRTMSIRLDSIREVWDEHSRLIDHLERKEKTAAVRLIKQHVSKTASQVLSYIRSKQSDNTDPAGSDTPQKAISGRKKAVKSKRRAG